MDELVKQLDCELNRCGRKYTRLQIENENSFDYPSNVYLYGIDNVHVVLIYAFETSGIFLAVYGVNDIEKGFGKINYFVPANLDFFYKTLFEDDWRYDYKKTYVRILRSIDHYKVFDIEDELIDKVIRTVKKAIR